MDGGRDEMRLDDGLVAFQRAAGVEIDIVRGRGGCIIRIILL
jgi:hypothetical protein